MIMFKDRKMGVYYDYEGFLVFPPFIWMRTGFVSFFMPFFQQTV